jgi:hypothetical protein
VATALHAEHLRALSQVLLVDAEALLCGCAGLCDATQGHYLAYVVHANRTEEIPAAGLVLAALLLDLREMRTGGAQHIVNSYLLLFGENGSDWSAGSSPMLLLNMRREATAAEKFGEKRFVVADVRHRGQVRVGVISNWNHSHEGWLGGNEVLKLETRQVNDNKCLRASLNFGNSLGNRTGRARNACMR